jgi:hypothetical protein
LKEKIAAPVLKTGNTVVGIRHADHVAPSIRNKLALTSLTSGGRSVGIVRLRTEATEIFFYFSSRDLHVFQNLPSGLCLRSEINQRSR